MKLLPKTAIKSRRLVRPIMTAWSGMAWLIFGIEMGKQRIDGDLRLRFNRETKQARMNTHTGHAYVNSTWLIMLT